MRKKCILPAITGDGQKTSVRVLIDAERMCRWLYCVRRRTSVCEFDFRWSEDLRSTAFNYYGGFCAVYKPEGIYVKVALRIGGWYRDVVYPLDEFYRMVNCTVRPATLSLCVTVTVD